MEQRDNSRTFLLVVIVGRNEGDFILLVTNEVFSYLSLRKHADLLSTLPTNSIQKNEIKIKKRKERKLENTKHGEKTSLKLGICES